MTAEASSWFCLYCNLQWRAERDDTSLDEDYKWRLHVVCWSKQHTQKTKGEIRNHKDINFLLYHSITWLLTRENPLWIQWTCDGPWKWLKHQLPGSEEANAAESNLIFYNCVTLGYKTDILFPGHLHEQHGHTVAKPASGTSL